MSGKIEVLRPDNTLVLNAVSSLHERNAAAHQAIKQTAADHAKWDMAVGAAGIFGFAVPALVLAVATQGPFFYKPLAQKLAKIYNTEYDSTTHSIVTQNIMVGGLADIAGEFTSEFLMMIAGELMAELGFGVAASFVPGVGAFVGAALDYIIATTMTWRVGVMVAIYCQNGNQWVGSKKHTFEIAKDITGGLSFGLADLIHRFTPGATKPSLDVDLDTIPDKVPEVRRWQLENLRPLIQMMMDMGGAEMVREQLRKRGVPSELIERALKFATQG